MISLRVCIFLWGCFSSERKRTLARKIWKMNVTGLLYYDSERANLVSVDNEKTKKPENFYEKFKNLTDNFYKPGRIVILVQNFTFAIIPFSIFFHTLSIIEHLNLCYTFTKFKKNAAIINCGSYS